MTAVAGQHATTPVPVSLAEVLERAALLTRFDRKYLVPPAVADEVIAQLAGSLGVLDMDGRQSFAYESIYFDTPDRLSYHDAAHGRRRRFKVRARAYLDAGECALEVKRRGQREETVKERMPCSLSDHGRLTVAGRAFVADLLPALDLASLAPALTTTYRRTTFVELAGGARCTCDAELVCATPDGTSVRLDGYVLIETKSTGTPTAVDRTLWRLGVRPQPISKYCVGLATLDPSLSANKWNRTLRRRFASRYDTGLVPPG